MSNELSLSPQERKAVQLLFIEPDKDEQQLVRPVLQGMGLGVYTFAAGHHEGLALFEHRKFTHVIFPAEKTNLTAAEFVTRVFAVYPRMILIPSSWHPDADDVFTLLQMGAAGFLCKPFTYDSVEGCLVQATKGEPIAQAILDARDRNEAFAALLAGSIDRLATVLRQSRTFDTAQREVEAVFNRLVHSAHIARTFCRGGEDELIDSFVEFFSTLAAGPATRLGRLRQRLGARRTDPSCAPRGARTVLQNRD